MWFLQRLRGKMEPFEAKSQLDNQQIHPDSPLQSDSSIDNDKLVQVLAQDLENLVLSCTDEVIDRRIQTHSVVTDEDDQLKQAADDDADDLRHLVAKEDVDETIQVESSSGSEEKSYKDEAVERRRLEEALEVDPEEVRVLEEREIGQSENHDAEVNNGDEENDRDEDVERRRLEEALEVDPEEVRVLEERQIGQSEIGCEEVNNGDEDVDLKEKQVIEIEEEDVSSEIGGDESNGQRRSDDGYDREYERVQDLENERKIVGGDGWEDGSVNAPDDGKSKGYHYPVRLDAEDCSYYIRTGTCKFGSNCKFNHPIRRKNQPTKETKKQKEENMEKRGQTDCKYHTSSAGCKYGKNCKFNHGRGKTVKIPVVEYNFLGLPIRPGEKECPYYMRNGSCKYGPTCRFNHPDPTAAGGGDSPTTYGNDGPLSLKPAPQPNIPNMPSWSAPRTPDPTAAFVPMMYPPTQNMPPPNPDWNGYQAPVPAHLYPSSEQGLPIPPAFFLNNPPNDTTMYTHQQQPPMLVSEYPERPGQPDCSYFMKTGVCKYRASCKFHHPQNRTSRTSRDQNICTYFSRHGTCKYGSACKYDHPVNYHSNSNPAREGYHGSNGPMIQQSV